MITSDSYLGKNVLQRFLLLSHVWTKKKYSWDSYFWFLSQKERFPWDSYFWFLFLKKSSLDFCLLCRCENLVKNVICIKLFYFKDYQQSLRCGQKKKKAFSCMWPSLFECDNILVLDLPTCMVFLHFLVRACVVLSDW